MILHIFFLAFSLLTSFATAACYFPNGTDRNANKGFEPYQPCVVSDDGRPSMCCRTNDGNPDTCQPDGLCLNDDFGGTLWREACTDKTWTAPECIKLCIDGDMAKSDVNVTQCDDGSLCCGMTAASRACCDRGQGRWIVNGQVVDANPSVSVAAVPSRTYPNSSKFETTSSPRAPIVASTSSTSPDPLHSESPGSNGAIIGGLVGGLGGALLIILSVLAILWLHRSRSIRRAEDIPMQDVETSPPVITSARKKHDTWIKPELDGTPISSTSHFGG